MRNKELTKRSLLKVIEDHQNPAAYNFQLHSLIAQYFRAKLEEQSDKTELKQEFCGVMRQVAGSIDSGTPTLKETKRIKTAIPHLSNVATELTEYVDYENLLSLYLALGRCYGSQGIDDQAEQWYEKSLHICREHLVEKHSLVAASISNLAIVYRRQGKYDDAETLHLEALNLRQQVLDEQHPDIAESLADLATLYSNQGKYDEAEKCFLQADSICENLESPEEYIDNIAACFNNLALNYQKQGKYDDAEAIFLDILEFDIQRREEQDPLVANSINNLA